MVDDSLRRDVTRAVRKYTLKAAQEHTLVQGQVVYAANLLQDKFFHLFRIALSLERPDEHGVLFAENRFHDHAVAIWHIIQADSSQRDMALTAISTVPTKLPVGRAVGRLKWAKNKANKLGEYRNLVAHSPIIFSGRMKGKTVEMVPNFAADSMRPVHKSRLEMINGLSFWRTLRNDLIQLSEYVHGVNVQIQRMDIESRGAEYINEPKTWPDRPRLRSLPLLEEIDRKLSRAAQKPGRRNRRQSSRRKAQS
jgi:hypothetical protein